MRNKKIIIVIFILIISTFIYTREKPEIKVQKISETLSVISGIGGNIAVLKGENSLLVIDTGVRQTGKILKEKIQKLFNLPVKILINTHYHGDHTGGNRDIAEGSTIIAHKNCLTTLKRNNDKAIKDKKKRAGTTLLPNKTFVKGSKVKFDGESILLFHFGPGHTSGDIIVVFKKNKVVHTGDLFFNNIAPYIDVKDGSNTKNWIKTIKILTKKFADYKVIPGHGELTDMKKYTKFADYLAYIRNSVQKAIKEGKGEKETVESISFKNYSHVKEKNSFMTKKNNVKWIYQEIKQNK